MHKVKCFYCEEYFDRDTTKFQKVGRRYAHLTCHGNIEEGYTKASILNYATEILGQEKGFSYARITKQIDKLILEGKTLSGIYMTLKYWYEVQKNSTSKSNGGIGIVPYVYQDAKEYWASFQNITAPKVEQQTVYVKRRPKKEINKGMLGDGD